MRKKFLSACLALALVFALLPGMAFAADDSDFVIDEDGVLTGYTGDGGDVVIPDGVTAIGENAFKGNTALISVTIPEGVTSIGSLAFGNCMSMTSVVIPEGVATIGNQAFLNCKALTSVTIPDGVTAIEQMAFFSCSALTSVTIPASATDIGGMVFLLCDKVTDVYYDGDETAWNSIKGKLELGGASITVHYTGDVPGAEIPDGPEPDVTEEPEKPEEPQNPDFVIENGVLTGYTGQGGDVVIPKGVTDIGAKAFYQMTALTSVTIPEGVTGIGNQAFFFCSAQTIALPASLTSIGNQAFDYCRSLTDVYYGGDLAQWIALTVAVTEYGNGLNSATVHFADGSILEPAEYVVDENGVLLKYTGKGGVVMIPDDVTAIGANVFSRKPLTGVIIPGSVQSIGDNAFYNCYDLVSVTMDPGVTAIGEGAFRMCGKLAGVELPDTVTSIGTRAFGNCTALTSVKVLTDDAEETEDGGIAPLSADAQGIGEYAFVSCTSLRSADIPSGVTRIGTGAFSGCSALESVTIPDSVTGIASQAFNACGSLISVNYTGSEEEWAQIEIKQSGNDPLLKHASITYDYDPSGGTEGPSPGVGEQDGEKFTIKDGVLVKYSGTDADVVVPAGVTAIGASAFEKNMTLKSVTLPAGVKTIGNRAFMNCVLLERINLPDGLTAIGDCAFDNCKISSITIPSTVTSLGENAFATCLSLTSVTIPGSVKHISSNAFSRCEALTSVTIQNGVTGIGSSAFHSCSALPSITIPASVTAIEALAFKDCTSLASITVAGNPTFGIPNTPDGDYLGNDIFKGTAWLKNQGDFATLNGRLVAYQGKGGNVTIPNTVTAIENLAFANNAAVTSVTIPGSVKAIRNSAFFQCTGLTSVTLQNGVTGIERHAFYGCSKLAKVTVPTSVTSIGVGAFSGCAKLMDVYYEGSEEQWRKIDGYINLQYELDDGSQTMINHFAGGTLGSSAPSVDPIRPSAKFIDMERGAFYLDAVDWAVSKNITTGTTATTFSPKDNCTHGQILTFLWRAAGEPKSNVTLPFATTGKEYYLGAVKWAYEKGMIGADFNHKTPCTRADAVNYIWQAFGKKPAGYDGRFTDVPASSPYATAVAWALANGVTTGATATTFNPTGICNRGQIVTFLYRAYK